MEVIIIIAIVIGVVVSNMKKQQQNEQRRKQEQARAAFEQRAKENVRVPEGQSAMWGTPDYMEDAYRGEGSMSSDPFCQGPAGSFSSSEGIGYTEGSLSTEGIGQSEGQSRSGEGEDKIGSPRLSVVQSLVTTKDTVHTVQALPDVTLSFDRNAMVQGILYAEILGKPNALRRG